MTSYFAANYPGRCGTCGNPFVVGDLVAYDDGDDLVAKDCCGSADDPRIVAEKTVATVMPRGKTAKDRCDVCFQVPASNGVCGCA